MDMQELEKKLSRLLQAKKQIPLQALSFLLQVVSLY